MNLRTYLPTKSASMTNKKSGSNLGTAASPSFKKSRQRMDSPAACAMPTADESNHSAADTPHLHHIDTCNFAQLCHKVPIRYSGMFHIYPQNCPFPLDDLHPHLIHLSLERLHSLLQTAFRSSQPFFHNSRNGQTNRPTVRQTDRQTDRSARRQLCSNTRLRSIVLIDSNAANNVESSKKCKAKVQKMHNVTNYAHLGYR